MRFVVTGGAGFIGSNLVKRLIDSGSEVVVFDNYSTGSDENLGDLGVEYTSRSLTEVLNREHEVDGVFHLGMPSSSPMYRRDPHLVDSTIREAITLLEAYQNTGTPFVLASTSSLYNGNKLPYNESMSINVTDYYTETRYAIERLFEYYSRFKGIRHVALRLFSVYGENESNKGVYANLVYQFASAMRRGERPVLYGDGSQRRDFIYQGDVVNCFDLAMKKLVRGEELPRVINVGTGVNYSLVDLVQVLNEALGSDVKPEFVENKVPGYVDATLADCALMHEHLLKAEVSLTQGVRKVFSRI